MGTFYITGYDCDSHTSYDAASFATIEEAKEALDSLYDALEDATVSQSYRIEGAIRELWEQIREAESLSD